MSQGYTWGGGFYQPKKFEIVGPAPAGSMASSAADVAKFMIAHLNDGAYNGQRILADSTAKRMHTRAFGHDPRIPGFALGFYEQSRHGLRIIGHGGDTQWFHTDLALIPAETLNEDGVFLDDDTLRAVREACPMPILPSYDFIDALSGEALSAWRVGANAA